METTERPKSMWSMMDQMKPGSNVETVSVDGDRRVLRVVDRTGEGIMTMYQVLDGVYLMYNDFRMEGCVSEFQAAESMLCLGHCRTGSIEHFFGQKALYYVRAGDLRVDQMVHHAGYCSFPQGCYSGITIGFQTGRAEPALEQAMPSHRFDLKALAARYCDEARPFVIRGVPAVEQIFEQLYHVPAQIRQEYFRLKVLELLLYLEVLDLTPYKEERPYFYVGHVEKIKAIQALITGNLDQSYTLEELSARFGIALTPMKRCFRSVYGAPIYTYLRGYRMNCAARLLREQPQRRVSDIAEAVGYDSPSKFSAAFRAVMGQTPLEYRRQNHREEIL